MQSSSSLNGPGAGWPWDTKYRDPRIRGRLTLNSGIARWVAEVIDASLNLDNAGQRKPPDPRHSWVLQARVFSLHLLSFTCRQLSSFFPLFPRSSNYREFTQRRRRRRQRERQKSKRFRQAKQQLCTCITFFCTFLCRRCTTTTWNCLIPRFVEDGNTRQQLSFFFSWTLMQSFRIQLQDLCQHLTN